jgi:alkyl sulfatase BDS1-like metallo-beta-lactamase superfamily hydrolase
MNGLPSLDDRTDFDNAERGFVAALKPGVIKTADGRVLWDSDSYAFLDAPTPGTANPSLWRQGQLCAKQGLFHVADGIYQVRALDLSNISFIEGDTGVIVIDPLISVECAAAALGLYHEHRGNRPVTAVIYTHSHGDHFGGVRGVMPADASIPIIAPAGFLEHAVSENVYAGTAMTRRAVYMYGAELPRNAAGQIGAGLGLTTSTGTISLIPPTLDITHTGQEEVIDGVRIVFQLTPGTEAPAEMNFYFPDKRALCAAENATHNLHNLLTLRGAVVRNPHTWARYLTETMRWSGPGTPAATTVRSATTLRPSTSTTWAGSTATRRTCGNSRRSKPRKSTSSTWAAPKQSSRR